MEKVFKEALQQMQKAKFSQDKEFSEARYELFDTDWTYGLETEEISAPQEELSEKKIVLESFTQFAHEKIAESTPSNILGSMEENGAKISSKDNKSENDYQSSSDSKESILEAASSLADQLSSKIRFDGKEKIKILFVSDYILAGKEEYQTEFEALFDGPTALLFSKMVKAMRLEKKDFLLSAMGVNLNGEEKANSYKKQLIDEISFFQPQVIMALGVSATHGLLDIKDRLKDVHGQFLDIKVNNKSIPVMPIFSPHLLGSAPNMKKIAWLDMQKVMEKLEL